MRPKKGGEIGAYTLIDEGWVHKCRCFVVDYGELPKIYT